MILILKMISIQHHHGNITHSNHGNWTQPNKDFNILKKHRVNDHFILSMGEPRQEFTRKTIIQITHDW